MMFAAASHPTQLYTFLKGKVSAMTRPTVFVAIALCIATTGAAKPQQSTHARLFIRNSYTYFKQSSEVFARLAETGHHGRVETRMVAPGGWR